MSKSMTATLKYALISDKKLALIAKLVKWKKVLEALTFLEFLPKKWATILHKVIKSAYSNALQSWTAWELYVQRVDVTKWPKIKRIRFVSRSRISHYLKYRSFVRVVLNVK